MASQLEHARRLLTGEKKDDATARKLLLEVAQNAGTPGDREALIWSCIYLGYIEDRAGNRQVAVGWYEKALAVDGIMPGAKTLATQGLSQPLLWIRHLDEAAGSSKASVAEQPKPAGVEAERTEPKRAEIAPNKPVLQPNRRGWAYVTKYPPALALATNLTEKERRENFEALWSIIDANYAHFELKGIDWQEVGKRYMARLNTITNDDDFYLMMYQLVNELKDSHSKPQNYLLKGSLFSGSPDVAIDLFQDKFYVVEGERAGWEVVAVDGKTIPQCLEVLRPYYGLSSERAFKRVAARFLLAGNENKTVTATLRSPQGQTETVTYKRHFGPPHRPSDEPRVSIVLTKGRFVDYGRYPSGLGYIHARSFNGRKEITDEFDQAMNALRDTNGLMLDIRDNPGGFNHDDIVGRFLHKRTFVGYSYIKRGLKHNQLEKRKDSVEARKWEYKQPVALLVSDVTGSAADLFTRAMRAAPRVTTIGTTTHGNLSGVAVYAVLPCGLVVRISNGYLSDTKDRSIEVNGNVPDITVETDIQDYLTGRDPVIEHATTVLLKGGQPAAGSRP